MRTAETSNFCSGSGTRCIGACCPLDFTGDDKQGGLMPGQLRASISSAQAYILERYSSFASSINTTQKAAVTGSKLLLDWHRVERQGLSPTVGEIIISHWITTVRHKTGQPPDNRLLSRHSLAASMGAWGLEFYNLTSGL
ncbi:unnamed protein product [Natator depressus]